jgi:hypothetical protein
MNFKKILNYLKKKLFPGEQFQTEIPLNMKLLSECEIMFNYAVDDGLKIPGWVGAGLSGIGIKLSSLTEGDKHKDVEEGELESAGTIKDESGKLTLIHAALSEIVAPATPLTIRYTTPRVRFLIGEKTTIPLIRNIWLMSLLFLIGFVLTFNWYDQYRNYIYQSWHLFFAAGLGAYFYSLYTANKYFIARTFDPRYNTFYNNRIILGIIAGFILANLIDAGNLNSGFQNISETISDADNSAAKNTITPNIITRLSPSIVALIGGYSADAVNKILSRIVAMITALFQGDSKDLLASKEAEYKSKSELRTLKLKLESVSKIMEFLNENRDTIDPDIAEKLTELVSEWLNVNSSPKEENNK